MSTLTTRQGLVLPASSDADNVPTAMASYNDGVENRLVQRYASIVDRAARVPVPTEGEISYLNDLGRYETYTGVSWEPLLQMPNGTGINNAGAADTTTSATYVNLAGTSSFSFTKLFDDTRLKAELHSTAYTTGATTDVRYAVRINSTDFDIADLSMNVANDRKQTSGARVIAAASVPAGTYTVQARWRRVAGSGTLTRAADDWLSMFVTEIAP